MSFSTYVPLFVCLGLFSVALVHWYHRPPSESTLETQWPLEKPWVQRQILYLGTEKLPGVYVWNGWEWKYQPHIQEIRVQDNRLYTYHKGIWQYKPERQGIEPDQLHTRSAHIQRLHTDIGTGRVPVQLWNRTAALTTSAHISIVTQPSYIVLSEVGHIVQLKHSSQLCSQLLLPGQEEPYEAPGGTVWSNCDGCLTEMKQ